MYELPWFKTETNIFSNRKIQLILKLTEGDTYFRVWIQLIALAVAVTTRCESCIGVHADEAVKAGATEEEVAAALAMSIALNAGAAYTYSLRALEAYNAQKGE